MLDFFDIVQHYNLLYYMDTPLKQHTDDSAKAARLALLLAQSEMPQEQKEAWIHMLPVMLPEQVDGLVELLEQEHRGYVDAGAQLMKELKQLEGSVHEEVDALKTAERELIDRFIKGELKKWNG